MWYNALVVGMLRSPLHGLLSRDMLLVTYKGRTSGTTYTVPLSYISVDEGLLILTLRSKVWWRNVRGGAPVTLRLRGNELPAYAEAIEDAASVAAGLRQMLARRPDIARFFKLSPALDTPIDQERLAEIAGSRVIVRARPESI